MNTQNTATPRPMRARAVVAISAALTVGTAGLVFPTTSLADTSDAPGTAVSSPDGRLSIGITTDNGRLAYSVRDEGTELVASSDLGLKLTGGRTLGDTVEVAGVGDVVKERKDSWKPIVGTRAEVDNHYDERTIELTDDGIAFSVIVRAYDDGVALRYAVPEQDSLPSLDIVDELTEFDLAGDPTLWWTKQDFESDENTYSKTPYSKMGAANTPVTARFADGTHLSIHEADLTDYSAMTVRKNEENKLQVELVPAIGREAAVVTDTGRSTPWRAVKISPDAGGLIESYLLENLNPPLDTELFGSEEKAREWIKAVPYVGIWWMLHDTRAGTWEEGPQHGATTVRSKEYIDFAAEHGLSGLLAEGWNKGWDGSWGDMDFFADSNDFSLDEVTKYGKEKGVEFIAHNETGANIWNYEAQIKGTAPGYEGEKLFEYYKSKGVHYLKTGYVGNTTSEADGALTGDALNKAPRAHHKYDQTMVNHSRFVLIEAAKNQININSHESPHATGESRTYPNAISREAVRGQEYDAWSEGNSPEHTMIIPFTRMVSGPMDYTPGVMNITWDPKNTGYRVHTTAAKQLAQAVNYFSGVQMAADLPEFYKLNRGIEFYNKLPASWDDTKVLKAEIGETLVTARRSGETWYVGAMTGESAQNVTYSLGFLGEGQWVAEVFTDDAATNYDSNPIPIAVNEFKVTSADSLTAALERSGGQAVRIRPATAEDADLPSYVVPKLSVTAIEAPSSAQAGDIVNVKVVASNEGSLPARGEVTLEVSGAASQKKAIAADASGKGSATFQVRIGTDSPVTLRAGDVTAEITLATSVGAPTLEIVRQGAKVIELQWEKVEGAAGYELFRRTESGTYAAVPRSRMPGDVTSFRDARLSGASYRYVLRAISGPNRSAASNEVGGLGPVVATLTDPVGDDNGPGSYTYPKAGQFVAGAFDVTNLSIHDAGHSYSFVTSIAGAVTNPFGGNAISLQHLEVYIGDGTPGAVPARDGTNLTASSGWGRVVVADGRFDAAGVFDASNKRVSDVALSADAKARTITVTVPKDALPGYDPTSAPIGVAMFANGEGGEGINYIRPVYDWNDAGNPEWLQQWRPGGGLGHLDDSKPSKDSNTRDGNAFDIIVGEGQAQASLLDWEKGSPVLPLVPAARP